MKCARCGHDAGKHCKGNIEHVGGHKSNFEYVTTCVGRHCKEPLCSCVDLVGPAAEK